MPEKNLIFLSAHDHRNVLNWSGILYNLSQTLEQNDLGVKLHYIDGGWLDLFARQFNRVLWHMGFKHDCRYSSFYAICSGLFVSAHLIFMPKGPILAVGASNYVPYLITKRPIIYITDAPLRAAAKIYPYLKDLPPWLLRQFDRNEQRGLRRSSAIIVPSKWASDSATADYGIESERIFEIPFGANIPDELIEGYYTPKSAIGPTFNLVFVSADWARKGGDKAIAICRALMEQGMSVRLVVIGDAPKEVSGLEFVDAKGFLNKSDREQLASLCRAYRDAHFLLLPTQADASPIVFSESRAFGVPPVTHLVGGASSAIDHRETGLLLPLDATPNRFAKELLSYAREPGRYEEMSRKSRRWYVEHAHWSNWSKLILKLAGLDELRGGTK